MAKIDEDNLYNKYNLKWVIPITIWTFVISIILSVFSESLVQRFDLVVAFIILLIIILIGIIFDVVGVAVTSANEKPFHAMAANKIPEAKIAIKLVRNAGKVSNFCNDVIGDISGILSGAISASIVIKLVNSFSFLNITMITILLTAFTASMTVGGKGIGKSIAMNNDERIVYWLAKILKIIENTFKIKFFNDKSNK
jgi:CBS domain containing-hemolysin-like protein